MRGKTDVKKALPLPYPFLLLALITVIGLNVSADDHELAPTPQQSHTSTLIEELLVNEHYQIKPLDDELSEQILARYLSRLDPDHMIFLKADILGFSKFRDKLDDALRNGDLNPIFEIFSLFRIRLNERVKFAIQSLDVAPDLQIDERYQHDRAHSDWPENRAALDVIWQQRIKNDYLNLLIAGNKPDEVLTTLRRRYQQLYQRRIELQSNDVFSIFINAYLSTMDPHTAYFLPRRRQQTKQTPTQPLEGIGVQLKTDNEQIVVKRIFAGGSADRQGQLHEGDRILGVGEGAEGKIRNVVGWTLREVVELIRGPKGSHVRLQIVPRGANSQSNTFIISLTRDSIKLRELTARKSVVEISDVNLNCRFGVIAVPRFYIDYAGYGRGAKNFRSTARDVEWLLDELKQDRIDGIIIDLRGNKGGALLEAVRLVGLFVKSGPIVQVKSVGGHVEVYRDDDQRVIYPGPLAVLVDRYSASASEIVAAAIQDYHRGIVVGERTFGKGTVQRTYDLNSFNRDSQGTFGQLVTTIAVYFRVTGESTQVRGVNPDISLLTTFNPGRYGERFERNALSWKETAAVQFKPASDKALISAQIRMQHHKRIEHHPVFHFASKVLDYELYIDALETLPLLEKRRRELSINQHTQRRALENDLRVALGLKRLAPQELDDNNLSTRWNKIVLEETALILRDTISGCPCSGSALNIDSQPTHRAAP